MSGITEQHSVRFFAALEAGDEAAAHDLAFSVAESGAAGVATVLDELLPGALARVGHLWEDGTWSVAQEHLATDICVRIVERLAGELEPPSTNDTVLVACAEGEWHSLASRIVGVAVRLAGRRALVVGPSITSSQLAGSVFDSGPVAIAVSCSMPANLPGARRMIEAAHDTGTPIVVGGRAFGDSPSRAIRLGADGWFDSSLAIRTFLDGIDTVDHNTGDTPNHRELALLRAHLGAIMTSLSTGLDTRKALDGEMASGGVWMLRSLQAALMCDEIEILEDQMRWHSDRAAIGMALPTDVVAGLLLESLPESASISHEWLRSAAAATGIALEL